MLNILELEKYGRAPPPSAPCALCLCPRAPGRGGGDRGAGCGPRAAGGPGPGPAAGGLRDREGACGEVEGMHALPCSHLVAKPIRGWQLGLVTRCNHTPSKRLLGMLTEMNIKNVTMQIKSDRKKHSDLKIAECQKTKAFDKK